MSRVGLPERIISGFKQWQKRSQFWSNPGTHIRLQRPSIYLDPHGEGVCIELPPQQFPYDTNHKRILWQILDSNTRYEIPTERQKTEYGYEFSVQEIVPLFISPTYEVTLRNETEIIKTWTLKCLDESQLLLFDPATGALLRRETQWQSGEKWIVYPNNCGINISNGEKFAEFPQQYGSWGKFAIEGWILKPGSKITLRYPGAESKEFPILEDMAFKRPFLTGGNQPITQSSRTNLPLYVGQPPLLQIPLNQKPDELQLSRWQISIEPEGFAEPRQPRTLSLIELLDWIICENNEVLIELRSPKLLGERPCGTFEIDVQGPLGRGKKFRARFVPQLEVNGHNTLYLTPDDGEAELSFSIDPSARLSAIQSDGITFKQIDLSNTARMYYAKAAIEKYIVKFIYFSSSNVQVPFHLNIRRLRWSLWDRTHPDGFTWTNRAIRLFPQSLVNISETELFVDLPSSLGIAPLYAGWRLMDPQGKIFKNRPPDPDRSASQFSILLDEILPECRLAQDKGITLCLQACIVTGEAGDQHYVVDLLYLTPYLDLGETESEWFFDGNKSIHLSLTWETKQPSPYLKLYLWPRDQPWLSEPVILDVPQTKDGFAEWIVSVDDIPQFKKYGGEFLGIYQIHDPWSIREIKRPLREPGNAIIFRPSYSAKYYQWLVKGLEAHRASLNKVLTLLIYFYRTRNHDQMYHVNKYLCQLAKQKKLNLEQLVFWATVIRDLGNPVMYRTTQIALFNKELLEEIELSWATDSLLPGYLAHLPSGLPENIYVRLLQLRQGDIRNKCIVELCRMGNLNGYKALLTDVENGGIVVSEAAIMLVPSASKACNYLKNEPSTCAFDVFRALSRAAKLDVQWLEPGFVLDSSIGILQVKQIFDEKGAPLDYCRLESACCVSVFTANEYESVSGKLNLQKKRIIFTLGHIYQCIECKMVFEDHAKLAKHHDAMHPLKSPSFRIVRPAEFKLDHLIVSSTGGSVINGFASD